MKYTRKLLLWTLCLAGLSCLGGCLSPYGRSFQERRYVEFVVETPDATVSRPETRVAAKATIEWTR